MSAMRLVFMRHDTEQLSEGAFVDIQRVLMVPADA